MRSNGRHTIEVRDQFQIVDKSREVDIQLKVIELSNSHARSKDVGCSEKVRAAAKNNLCANPDVSRCPLLEGEQDHSTGTARGIGGYHTPMLYLYLVY